jgi:chorismate mutase-like protein
MDRPHFVNPLAALVDAAAQRLLTAEAVAAWKFNTGGVVVDPRREQEVIDAVATYAVARSVDPDYVRGVFRDQIDATRALEHGRIAQWRLDPASVPACVPELSACRATSTCSIARWSTRLPCGGTLALTRLRPRPRECQEVVIGARRLDGLLTGSGVRHAEVLSLTWMARR